MAPTLAAANALYERRLAEAAKGDANNQLWAIEAIQDYDPEPDLDKIKAKVLLVNDAEDYANPPELGTVERAMKRVKNGRYVLIPPGPDTHGHFSHYYAKLWKPYLIEFLASLDDGAGPSGAMTEALRPTRSKRNGESMLLYSLQTGNTRWRIGMFCLQELSDPLEESLNIYSKHGCTDRDYDLCFCLDCHEGAGRMVVSRGCQVSISEHFGWLCDNCKPRRSRNFRFQLSDNGQMATSLDDGTP